jgi:phosphonate transport system substrate-binding protein
MVLASLCGVATGCRKDQGVDYTPVLGDAPHAEAVEYAFGVFPLQNPIRLFNTWQPVLDLVNEQTAGITLRVEAGRDYASYEAKLRTRVLAFAVLNPYQALKAEEIGYRIFAKLGNDPEMCGIIVTRKDAGVASVNDLRGAKISFPAPTAIAATLMTKLFLKKLGLDVDRDAQPTYVGSLESSVMNVYQGLTKAGGAWPPTWEALRREKPEVIEALRVSWRTPPISSLAVVARDDVPPRHVALVRSVLLKLHESERGRGILQRLDLPRFEAADASRYEAVRAFLREYEHAFGKAPPLEAPQNAARAR